MLLGQEALPLAVPAEIARAWRVYLKRTRNLIGWRYEESEPWAWKALQDELAEVRAGSN